MQMKLLRWSCASAFAISLSLTSHAIGGDFLSGTYLDPAEQRPDFFSHRLWNSWPEYRAVYNRPRYVGGHIAQVIEPTSQEAMAWKINKENGNYKNHCGPYVPHYYYPKPWEALNTRARPNTQLQTAE